METKLPKEIKDLDGAKKLLKDLYENGESFHPEDDPFDIEWSGGVRPSLDEKIKLKQLFIEMYELPEMEKYPDVEWDPCGYLLDLERCTETVKLVNPQPGEEELRFKVTNYNDVTRRCYITPINSDMAIPGQELVSMSDLINENY